MKQKLNSLKISLLFILAFLVFLSVPFYFIFIHSHMGDFLTKTLKIKVTPSFTGGELMAVYNDPRGDDKGTGTYTYSLAEYNSPYSEHLDLIKYIVKKPIRNFPNFRVKEIWAIELMFKRLENPLNAPGKFTFPQIQIYIHLPGKTGGKTTLLFEGAQVNFDSRFPWHYLISVNGFNKDGSLYNDKGVLMGQVSYDLIHNEDKIRLLVPIENNPDFKNFSEKNISYHYVLIGSYDVNGKDNFRPIVKEANRHAGGGNKDPEIAPLVYDILVPEQENQYQILNSYNLKEKTYATLKPVEVKYGKGLDILPEKLFSEEDLKNEQQKTRLANQNAIHSLEKLVQENPDDIYSTQELAALYFKTGKEDQSEILFRKIAKNSIQNPIAMAYLGAIHAKKAGQTANVISASKILKESFKILEEAAHLAPEDSIAMVHVLSCRIGVYLAIPENFHKTKSALKDLEKLIPFLKKNNLTDQLYDNLLLQGQAYEKLKFYKKAGDSYYDALHFASNDYQKKLSKEKISFAEYKYIEKMNLNLN